MEKRIKRIFDFQRFSGDARLEKMISDAESRYCEISDEYLELVSAAGDPFANEEDAEDAEL